MGRLHVTSHSQPQTTDTHLGASGGILGEPRSLIPAHVVVDLTKCPHIVELLGVRTQGPSSLKSVFIDYQQWTRDIEV